MTINDSNWQFLHDATGLSLPFNEMYFHYLRDEGYTGTLQEMIAKSGLGLNPSGLKNPANNPEHSPWYTEGATEFDYTNNRFYKGGVEYETEADFFTALKGGDSDAIATNTSGKIVVGRYVSPGNTEELLNPNFDTDDSGWTVGQSSGGPASQAVVNGVLQLTGNGSTNARSSQQFTPVRGRAYKAKARVGRGTGSNVSIRAVIGNSSGSTVTSGSSGAVAMTNYNLTFSSIGSEIPLYAVALTQGSAIAGFNQVDYFSIKECWPFDGYQPGSVSGKFRFTADSTLNSTKVLFSFDNGAQDGANSNQVESNRIVLRTTSAGVLQLLVQSERTIGAAPSTECTLALGTLSPGAEYVVEFAVTDSFASANLNGGTPVQSTLSYIPGIAYMRLHGSQLSTQDVVNRNSWMTLYNELRFPEGYPEPDTYVVRGDSYGRVGGKVATATGLITVNKSFGGWTLDQILAGTISNPLAGEPTIFWDGKPNGYVNLTDYMGKLSQIGDLVGWSNFAIAPPMKTSVGSSDNTIIQNITTAIIDLCLEKGCYYIDAPGLLYDGTGVVNPAYMEPDQVHVNAAGNVVVAGNAATPNTFAWALKQMGAY